MVLLVPAKTRNTWKVWDVYFSWTWCSNVVYTEMNEIEYTSCFLKFVGEYSCISNWKEFCLSVGQVIIWIFLVLHFYGSVCKRILKLIWPRINWLWIFFVGICLVSSLSLSYLQGLKSGRIVQLRFSFVDMKSFRILVWQVFWSVF